MDAKKIYPSTKEIIFLLGMGTLLAASILVPGVGVLTRKALIEKRKREWQDQQKKWKKFNGNLLRMNLKRLQKQRVIEIITESGQEVIKLTQKGQTRFLKLKLEDIALRSQRWDGRWRIVSYDIKVAKRTRQAKLRRALKSMRFYPYQKSVYLTPYPCNSEVEYLRHYLDISDEVAVVVASKIENEQYFKEYFGL